MCDARKGTSTRKARLNPDVVAQQQKEMMQQAQALTPPPPAHSSAGETRSRQLGRAKSLKLITQLFNSSNISRQNSAHFIFNVRVIIFFESCWTVDAKACQNFHFETLNDHPDLISVHIQNYRQKIY